ncbi:MAG: TonB-dependent receptor [Bdellovibrionaceae bacterium]|nr:TonB-dependent receptor [Pseudobdellovibrionaceae bacterium]
MIQFILSLFLFPGVVFAQSTQSTTTVPGTAPKLETPPPQNVQAKKIVVTGSYIKRVDEEGPAAVQTINKEDLKKQGQNSVADVLRNAAISGGGTRETSGSNQAGTATASLRGFGSGDILVLLNGQRLPKIGGGNTVDLNLIPISAIERVEILKDGASALYGSDALGGVINFITKKDFNGSSITARYSQPEEKGGSRLDILGSTGYSNERFSILGVLQYRNNKAIYDADRDFSKIQDVATQGSPSGSPGYWIDDNGRHPGFPSNPCPANQIDASDRCRFDYSVYATGLPDIEQVSGMVYGTYKVSENIKASLNTIYNRRNTEYVFAPGPGPFDISNAQALALGLPAVGDVTIVHRTVEELGTRNTRNSTDAIIAQPTVEGKIGTWDWELAGSYGSAVTRNDNYNGYARLDTMLALLAANQWNPTAAPGAKGSLETARYQPWQDITTTQSTARLLTTGQIYGGGDTVGPLAGAIGISADRQDYKERVDDLSTADPDNIYGGGSGASGQGDRNFHSLFTELSFFPVDTIETGLALRYDKFSDFGSTFNPKLSASWQATKTTLFRASVGTGFRAPNLDSLYGGVSSGFSTFIDRLACNAGESDACAAGQYLVQSSGNRNLKEERSLFYNVGFATQPKKNWSLSVDAFYAIIKDRVGLSLTDLTRVEEMIGKAGVLAQYGIDITRVDGLIERIDGVKDQNLATDKTGGIDFSLKNETPGRLFGNSVIFQTAFDHQHVVYSRFNSFSILPSERNRDLNWRNVISFGVKTERQFYRLGIRTIPGGDKSRNQGEANVVGFGSTFTYTEYDFDYVYSNFFGGDLSFGLRNLFGSDRPLDDTVGVRADFLNDSIYDPVGRTAYLGYTYNF